MITLLFVYVFYFGRNSAEELGAPAPPGVLLFRVQRFVFFRMQRILRCVYVCARLMAKAVGGAYDIEPKTPFSEVKLDFFSVPDDANSAVAERQ